MQPLRLELWIYGPDPWRERPTHLSLRRLLKLSKLWCLILNVLHTLFEAISGQFRYPTTGRWTKHPWMNSTLSLINPCKPCNNRAQKQQVLLGPSWKSLPKQLVHVQTKTGAFAAQQLLQHNQISCAQHHQLHHNADTVFIWGRSTLALPHLHCQPMQSSSKFCQMLALTPSVNSLQIDSWSVACRIYLSMPN